MKRVLLTNGWDEVTIKQIRVERKVKPFFNCASWVDFQKRNPKINYGGRNHCERCGKTWKELPPETMTYFVVTNKGNKVVCNKCWDELEDK